MSRTEFGRERSTCGCESCRTNCRHMPGMLIPADLDRLIPPTVADVYAWSEQNLLASPGALVKRGQEIFRIPTLVPATKDDGSCIHFTAEGRCAIHETAPFGCAFFDCQSLPAPLDMISRDGMITIMKAHREQQTYARIWQHLDNAGKRQHAPEVLRARMRESER